MVLAVPGGPGQTSERLGRAGPTGEIGEAHPGPVGPKRRPDGVCRPERQTGLTELVGTQEGRIGLLNRGNGRDGAEESCYYASR